MDDKWGKEEREVDSVKNIGVFSRDLGRMSGVGWNMVGAGLCWAMSGGFGEVG